MNNEFIITLYGILFILSVIQVTISITKDRNKPIMKYYFTVVFLALFWQITNILYFVVTDAKLCQFIYELYLPFISFSSVFMFRFFYEFYNDNKVLCQKRPNWLYLYIIPTITLFLVLTTNYNDLIYKSFEMIQTKPAHIHTSVKGVWHWIHIIYTYIIAINVCIVVIKGHLRVDESFRTPSNIFIASLIMTMLLDLVLLSGLLPQQLNVTIISSVANLYLLYYAINYGDKNGFLIQAQKQVFDRLSEGVFVLDKKRNIIGLNKSAKVIFENKIEQNKMASFTDLENYMITSIDKDEPVTCSIDGAEVFISDKIYNLKQNEILDKRGSEVGTFVVLTDITKYKQLISRLEDYANFDSVTGLFNRHAFELEKHRLKNKMPVPLSIVMGDLNHLKYVNDTFGHEAGDDYIRLMARVLQDCIPSKGKAYRVGGDEFVLLLPNTDALQADKIINNIENTVSLIKRFPYNVSISLGASTINTITENIDNTIARADETMYAKKRIMKENMKKNMS